MSESFRALYDANAQAIEIESLKMQIDELHAALAERDAKLAALEKQDRHVRRLLCIAVADRPYMDDGEASDQEIDYLREPPADIERKLQERGKKRLAAAGAASEWNDFVEIACARIKSADDAAADGDYMLDSSDCIKVLRGTWGGNYLNDHPVLPTAGAAPVPQGRKITATRIANHLKKSPLGDISMYRNGFFDGAKWAAAPKVPT